MIKKEEKTKDQKVHLGRPKKVNHSGDNEPWEQALL